MIKGHTTTRDATLQAVLTPHVSESAMGGRAATALAAAVVVLHLAEAAVSASCRNPVLFNFGDSNSDTGGAALGFGYNFSYPEGRLFFNRSTGRICDGRLVVDFLCEELNTSYLTPYLESLEPNFRHGANFAIGGASTQPIDRAFSLAIQVRQFLHFKSRSLELVSRGRKDLIDGEGFKNALYMIDIGQNDLAGPVNLTYDQLVARIPPILSEIRRAIQTLYDNGGKNFWIHNTGPCGCMPQKLAVPRKDNNDLDPYGCLMSLNNAAKEFNAGFSSLCNEMSSQLTNATIVYIDIYAIKYDLIANSTKYGFDSPLMCCCGFGGAPYNFNPKFACGNPNSHVCPDGSQYISWDGVHYTEAANSLIAKRILSTNYSTPSVSFDHFCNA